ncbi:cytochrome P450 [Apiospora saccharicola]|uniref:Cytochrome P450 n=1 Tax=Apiospora saccharicola TaxID=335842 RepID=A0ABR1VPK6_9PEZI
MPFGVAVTMSTILPLFVVIGACYGLYLWLLPKPIPGIPFNPEAARSLLGDLPSMLEDVKATGEIYVWCCKQLSKMKSPIGQVFVTPFGRPWVLLADLSETKEILAHRRGEWDKSHYLSDGLASLDNFHGRFVTGPKFRANRQLTRELTSTRFFRDHAGPAAFRAGLELTRLLEAKAQLAQGRPFCAKQEMARALLRENWPMALTPQIELVQSMIKSEGDTPDIRLGPLEDQPVLFPKARSGELTDAICETLNIVEMTFNAIMPKLQHWLWSKRAWYKRLSEIKRRCFREQVATALRNMQSGHVVTGAEHMLKQEEGLARKEGREPDFDRQNIRDEMFGNMAGGHHTTGGSLQWLVKYLSDLPHVQKNLRHTLYATLADARREGRLFTSEELEDAKLPYLDVVLEEMLRLNTMPTTREAQCDTHVLGRPVKKGTEVFFFTPLGPLLQSAEYAATAAADGGAVKRSLDHHNNNRNNIIRNHDDDDGDDGKKTQRPDPALFEPRRWLVRKEKDGKGGVEGEGGEEEGDGLLAEHVDFDGTAEPRLGYGLGPRACWGRRVAMTEMRVIVPMLVWTFELQKCPPSLSTYAAHEAIARMPDQCYLRLRKL